MPDAEDVASDHGSDRIPSGHSLPAWPLALSGVGLCLAVLAINPDVREQAAPQQQRVAVAPQVQGWRGSVPARAEWPQDAPRAGYHGIGLPQSPSPELPTVASAPESTTPVPDVILAPLHAQPPASSGETASVAEPQPPANVPETKPTEQPPPLLAAAPAPAFVPPEPAWGLQPLAALPPAVAMLPVPVLQPQDVVPLPAPRRIPGGTSAHPEAPSRQSATAALRRAGQKARAKAQRDIEDEEGPIWREKVFGPRRS